MSLTHSLLSLITQKFAETAAYLRREKAPKLDMETTLKNNRRSEENYVGQESR